MPDLSIITVAGPDDGPLIKKNVELIHQMNPGGNFTIYVVDNSRHAGGAPVDKSDHWTLLDGVSMNDPALGEQKQASQQHGIALNRAFKTINLTSRYCLVLDPDFFILQQHWIDQVLQHMNEARLTFFGAPWHPKWFTKYRYFPCVHCMFLDTRQVDVTSLDFSPKLRESVATGAKNSAVGGRLNKSRFRTVFRFIYLLSLLRLDIGRSKDTGYRISEAFRKDPSSNAGMLTPYVNIDDWSKVTHLRHPIGRMLERLIPDRLSFIPGAKGYFTQKSLISQKLKNVFQSLVWEEFQWRGEIFGIHLRRFVNTENCTALKQNNLLNDLLSAATGPSTGALLSGLSAENSGGSW